MATKAPEASAAAVRAPESWLKYAGFFVWLAGLVVISVTAYCCKDAWSVTTSISSERPFSPPALLTLSEVLYFAAPVFTLFFTVAMHFADVRLPGGGLSHRAHETSELHNLKPDVISGTMTKLSVLAALASIFILFTQQQQDQPRSDYYVVVRLFASAGFLISIFFMLIAVKTYDYANRFSWENHPDHRAGPYRDPYYKVRLSVKAFVLDIVSFYFLIFTAILTTGLIVPWFPIAASAVCGSLLWITFFFWPKKKTTASGSPDLSKRPKRIAEKLTATPGVDKVRRSLRNIIGSLVGATLCLSIAVFGWPKLFNFVWQHGDRILASVLTLVFVIILVQEVLGRPGRHHAQLTPESDAELVNDVERRLRIWFRQYLIWNRLYWVLGLVGGVSAVIAAAKGVAGFAVTASVCIAIIGFLNPQRQAYRFIGAWRNLNHALISFSYKKIERDALIDALRDSELILEAAEVVNETQRQNS